VITLTRFIALAFLSNALKTVILMSRSSKSIPTLPYIICSMCSYRKIEDAQDSMYWLTMAGSLWCLLGFWCCRVSARSFLHSSEHCEYIHIWTICIFSGLFFKQAYLVLSLHDPPAISIPCRTFHFLPTT
jgi:hypothetical protein